MKLARLFSPRSVVLAGLWLFVSAAAQARTSDFYAAMGAPDTVEGRFEVYTLHVALVLRRLKGQGPQAAETAQGCFDAYVKSLDHALRELGEAFYGRIKNYDEAFAALPDKAPLAAMIGRTVLMGETEADPARWVGYATAAMAALDAQPLETLVQGEV